MVACAIKPCDQRLISQAALRDGGFAHSVEQLGRLLVGMKLFKGKSSKRRESRGRKAPKAQVFSFPNAGANDNAAGVGTRLLPLPFPFPASRLCFGLERGLIDRHCR